MDPVSIFGIITGAVSLLQAATQVAMYLKPARHLGIQVTQLREILEDFQHLMIRVGPDNKRELEAIAQAVQECNLLLAKYAEKSEGRLGRVFYWSKQLEEQIKEVNRQLLRQQNKLMINAVA
jgi:hypothetical protein